MWDLIPFNISVPLGGTFDDIIPGWGAGNFVSASTGLVISTQSANYSASPGWRGPIYYNGSSNVLSAASLEDVTHQVTSDGHLKLTFWDSRGGIPDLRILRGTIELPGATKPTRLEHYRNTVACGKLRSER